MSYEPGPFPQQPDDLATYLQREFAAIKDNLQRPDPDIIQYQLQRDEPPRPTQGETALAGLAPAWEGETDGVLPGAGAGLYWFTGTKWRQFAGIDELGILGGAADDVTVLDPPDFVTVINFAASVESENLTVDPVSGIISLPAVSGVVRVHFWMVFNQITALKDFSILAFIAESGVSIPGNLLAAGYIPQQSSDVSLVLSASCSRPVNGSEVFSVQLQLDNAATADFQILNSSFEVEYLIGAQSTITSSSFSPGQIP